ncbi:2Fe-2S iron-sulfur cluster-binding protein [Algoriphagus marinus]|jgi:2Fe-2S ferredoxin|uniref:2Fe-2S iron-sulfur cluster-binding protein n=1 Tax=Algoriphagus marinus TaxID=1925762 RepID=UPI00094B7B9E|nr:2Fe-2S iron-sulfur cluster-binding protein [Algoriphagus marinus]
MPQIVIENLFNLTIDVPRDGGKVIEIIHQNGIDWMHACGKKGRCTTCKIIVKEGIENLTEPTDREILFKTQGRLKPNERLACQVQILEGKLVGRVADINKFPHIKYSE